MRAISNAGGLLTHAADYSPYGTPLATLSDSPSSFGFAGEMADPTGLTYLRARYYHPASGTFMSQDPVLGVVGGPASTFNPYLYVRGNPVNWTDPSGEFLPLLLLGAAAVGALAGAAIDALMQLRQNGGRFDCLNLASILQSAILGAVSGVAGFLLAVSGAGALTSFLVGGAIDFVAGMAYDLAINKMSFEDALVGNALSFGIGGAIALGGHALGKAFRKLRGISDDVSVKADVNSRADLEPKTKMSWDPDSYEELLPGEGNVGTYEEFLDAGRKGDDVTPHHMPANEYMKRANTADPSIGYTPDEGIAMNMESPRKGEGRHQDTHSYGGAEDGYYVLSPRDALAFDIRNARAIYQKGGAYQPKIVEGLLQTIQRNKARWPSLFDKTSPWKW